MTWQHRHTRVEVSVEETSSCLEEFGISAKSLRVRQSLYQSLALYSNFPEGESILRYSILSE